MNKNKILKIVDDIRKYPEIQKDVLELLTEILDLRQNPYHPLVFIHGNPEFGKNVYIGAFSLINAKAAQVRIGDNCDIASYVSINVADSHERCIGLSDDIDKKPIILEDNVFVGSHCFIGGGTHIGHHSVVGAGSILVNMGTIPPYSLIVGNPPKVKKDVFRKI